MGVYYFGIVAMVTIRTITIRTVTIRMVTIRTRTRRTRITRIIRTHRKYRLLLAPSTAHTPSPGR
jgi:hypothetical protein